MRWYLIRLTGVEQVTYLNSVIMPDDNDEASGDGASNAEEPEQD